METFVFDSDDLEATETMLNDAYTKVRIGSNMARSRTRMTREVLGPVSIDQLELAFEMSYTAEAIGRICLCDVESGVIEQTFGAVRADHYLPGDLAMAAPADLPYTGVVRTARYRVTMLDPALLTQVAAAAPGRRDEPVRLLWHRPVSATAAEHLRRATAYLHDQVSTQTQARESPLVVASASQYLAASVLHAFPNNAVAEPTVPDRRDAHPDTLRRAITHIESHAREEISIADIAAGANVSIRAVQLAFRRHLDTTPMAYLRQVRLSGAHEQLVATIPGDGDTVTSIAAAWGFAHQGRFANLYRRAYGTTPRSTLHT